MSRRYSSPFRTDPIGGRGQWPRILLLTQERKRKGLTVEFDCGLSGDEGQFFWPG
jgi:hypothetical protein